ncbi:MAG: hypothetical protein JWP81_13, partial [Ferruginibacter sp.]|nr:hypothetical protein [Ferruginibacter sp.]
MKRIVLMLIVMVSFVYSNAQRILQTDTVRAKKVSADTVKASVFVGLPVLDTSHFASKDTTDALNLRILANNNSIAAHIANVSNPHAVTLQQLTAVGKTTTDSLTVATGTGKMFIVGNNSALPRPQLELDAKSQVFQPFGANGGGSYQGLRAGNPATYLGLRYNGSNGTPTPITGGDLVSYYG